jgi:hypothetical protein
VYARGVRSLWIRGRHPKLATSRDTSNGPDWRDVHQALANLELFAACKITLCIHNGGSSDASYLILEAKAEKDHAGWTDRPRSVYVQSTMRQLNVKTLSAAFLNLLHQLDTAVYKQMF